MLVCVLAAVVLFSRAGDRHPVLVVAHRVNAGSTIAATDLADVLVSADAAVRTVPATQRNALVGQVATVDLIPGSLLAPGQVDQRAPGVANQAVLGATLKEGQFPPSVRQGDRVLVIEVPADSTDPAQRTAQPATPVDATVLTVEPSSTQGGITVSLAVDPTRAQGVAVDAARGRLTIVIAPA
jgi:hypothetical protein